MSGQLVILCDVLCGINAFCARTPQPCRFNVTQIVLGCSADGSDRGKGLFLLIRQLVVVTAAAVWLRLQVAVGSGGALPTVFLSCITHMLGCTMTQ
jgi:hypothetical protein